MDDPAKVLIGVDTKVENHCAEKCVDTSESHNKNNTTSTESHTENYGEETDENITSSKTISENLVISKPKKKSLEFWASKLLQKALAKSKETETLSNVDKTDK